MIFEHNDCRYMKIIYVHSGEETNIRDPRSYKHYWTSIRYLDTCAKRRVEITFPSPLIFASHLNRQFQEVLIEDIIRARHKEDDWSQSLILPISHLDAQPLIYIKKSAKPAITRSSICKTEKHVWLNFALAGSLLLFGFRTKRKNFDPNLYHHQSS